MIASIVAVCMQGHTLSETIAHLTSVAAEMWLLNLRANQQCLVTGLNI